MFIRQACLFITIYSHVCLLDRHVRLSQASLFIAGIVIQTSESDIYRSPFDRSCHRPLGPSPAVLPDRSCHRPLGPSPAVLPDSSRHCPLAPSPAVLPDMSCHRPVGRSPAVLPDRSCHRPLGPSPSCSVVVLLDLQTYLTIV